MKVKRSLEESLVLHNLFIAIYPKMSKNSDKEFYKFVRDYTKENVKETSNAIIREVGANLIKEICVLINQMWVNNSNQFNESLIKEKNVFNAIKSEISNGEKFPFNNRELYKRIRESIAHNSSGIENCVYNLKGFELNLGKVNGNDYIVTLNINQLVRLFYVLFSNMQSVENKTSIIVLDENNLQTKQEIKQNIKIEDGKTGNLLDLDDNQIERFYNYFTFIKPREKNKASVNEFDSYCLPNNVDMVLLEKITALSTIGKMHSNTTWEDIQPETLTDIINNYFAIISNLFFALAASRTNSELEQMLDGCLPDLDAEKIRHLRNALCHGRYYHDFNKTFYFYDGKKELNFELKLTINEINKIIDKLASGEFKVVALKKFD